MKSLYETAQCREIKFFFGSSRSQAAGRQRDIPALSFLALIETICQEKAVREAYNYCIKSFRLR